MRLDKWLWAARFFKTRAMAQAAIEGGKVTLDGARVKPAKSVAAGHRIEIGAGEAVLEVTVLRLGARRGPAREASQLYEESGESRARRGRAEAERRWTADPARDLRGRPTKRDRRALERLRGEGR